MSVNYATNLHIINGRRGPDDMTPAQWHEAAIATTRVQVGQGDDR